MKRNLVMIILVSIFLTGCTTTSNTANNGQITTLNGVILSGNPGGGWVLQTDDGIKEIHDGNASLEGMVGNEVEVSGMYSGTTLYVDEVVVK